MTQLIISIRNCNPDDCLPTSSPSCSIYAPRGALYLTRRVPSMASQPVPLKSRRDRRGRRETLAAYLFLTPYLFVLAVFYIIVSFYGLGLSLFKVDIGFTAPQFIGLGNYQNIFQQLTYASDSDFWISIVNILKFTFFIVLGQTALALLLALLLQA